MNHSLQVNTAGAWRNVSTLDAAELPTIAGAVGELARLLGPRPTWRIVETVNGYAKVCLDDEAIRASPKAAG